MRLAAGLLLLVVGTAHAQATTGDVSTGGDAKLARVTGLPLSPSLLCTSALLCQGVCREACNLQNLVQQAVLATDGLPPGTDIQALAAKSYTPNAVVIVMPIAAFASGLAAFEYFLTFTRPNATAIPPAVANVTGSDFHDLVVSRNTVTWVFDLFLTSPFNASKKATLRGWAMTAFNEVSQITYQTIIYPLWEEVFTSLGLPEAYANSTVAAYVADQVCEAHKQYCTGTSKQYANKTACMAFMAGLPPPPAHRLAGNNLFCRLFHARYLDFAPAVHCPHIGPTGGGQCTEDLPYSTAKINALLPRPAFYSVNPLLQADINKTVNF